MQVIDVNSPTASDIYRNAVEEFLATHTYPLADSRIYTSALKPAYDRWALKNNRPSITPVWFGRSMKAAGHQAHYGGGTWYRGFALLY